MGDYFRRTGRETCPIRRFSMSCRCASASPKTRTITCRCSSRRSPTRPTGAADARRGPVPAARQGGEALAELSPTLTLLDYLRLTERATGTKEGCAEGDCGACTVVLRRLRGERLVYEPVNACILFAGQADGSEIITVEDLARDGMLHPVQQAMVDLHGSQCGFCTPGFVMALFALYHRADRRAGRPAARQRLDRRQSLPLHRLSADRRCGAFGVCAAGGRLVFGRGAARRGVPSLSCSDSEDIFIGTQRALLRRARQHHGARQALFRQSGRDADRGLDRCRPVGHQAAARPAQGDLARPREGARRDRGPARRGELRRDGHAHRGDAVSRGDRPRSRRADAPLRRHADPHGGDRRRQHRERLADRRPAARADRARRDARRCSAASGRAPCRWRTTSSTTASRTASRASSCAWCASRSSARASISAATRSPSASTPTFPP